MLSEIQVTTNPPFGNAVNEVIDKGTNPVKDAALTRRFYQIYRRERPDVVLHYTIKPNIYGSIAAKMAGIPSINNVSGLE